MSLSCALLATSLHQWARRYLRMAQPARRSPENRARMRAFFANGVEEMHVPWAVEGLPTLLHLSLFLFFGGLVIYLLNINHEVFFSVVWWIVFFLMVYGSITLLPIIRHDSPYNSPLSTPAWFLYARIHHITFKILASITPGNVWRERCKDLRNRSKKWMLGGVDKAASETASERSSKIDVQILDWTISALGDDDSQKSFFDAIPGFFESNLVNHPKEVFPMELLGSTLDGFLDRTISSNSVNDSEKARRLDIAMNAMNLIRHGIHQNNVSPILNRPDKVPQTIEMGHTLARWCISGDQVEYVTQNAQFIIARILVNVRERNDSWAKLASSAFGLPERDIRGNIALGGDSVLLDILIHVTRQYLRSDSVNWLVLAAVSKFDIHNTLPRLQHDFCTLWNDIVQEGRNRGSHTTPVNILYEIRHLYITLHQGTDAAPTAFSAYSRPSDRILWEPTSYPSCDIGSHHPDSTLHPTPLGNSPNFASSHPPTDGGNAASRQTM